MTAREMSQNATHTPESQSWSEMLVCTRADLPPCRW